MHLSPPLYPRRLSRTTVGPDGRFAIATTETGLVHLLVTGVDHYAMQIPLLIDAPSAIAVDVRLRPYAYTDAFDSVRVLGDFNRFSRGSAQPLVRQPDGRYALEVEVDGDTLAYQLLGLEVGGTRTINGPQADRYVYDEGGDYRSVIRVRGGRATIVLDPAALPTARGDASVAFRGPDSRAARIERLYRRFRVLQTAFVDSARSSNARRESIRFDWAPPVAALSADLSRERDPLVRELLMLQLIQAGSAGATVDTALAGRIVRELRPSSPWWSGEVGGPSAIRVALRQAAGLSGLSRPVTVDTNQVRATLEYADRVAAENPDRMVQAAALTSDVQLARALRLDQRANEYYRRLLQDYPDAPGLARLNSLLAPNRVMRVGAQIPAYSFAGLDDSTVTFTRESMLGRTYLLEFWATWCAPCLNEMPFLHAARDSLAADSVEFLFVSMDDRRDDVQRLRREQWRMPWLHAIAPGGFQNQQIRRLEILAVPTSLLIGPDGTILAVGPRGEELVAQVRQALREARRR